MHAGELKGGSHMLRGRKDTGTECKKMFLQTGGFIAEEACKRVRCLHVADFRCEELSIAGSFGAASARLRLGLRNVPDGLAAMCLCSGALPH